ncbi:macrophage mannose receptor 1-like [Pseudoliparis swirei]|uniref:macrophage mannose receptor 1-like n=1 Tax=Pseudoliparis swirei TaxID=2059687 RepID=UPI0024BD841E|nr:macrophage mannose receptor 1-like [Pseudoliparis swirei]
MKTSLVVCVLLGAVFSVKAASVPWTVEAVSIQPNVPANTQTSTVTGLYNDTTPTTRPVTTPTTTPITTPVITSPYPGTAMTSTTPTTTTPTPPPTQSQIMCPDGWEWFKGRCYYFVNTAMTWPQAQSNCALRESMLVSVHSVQEYGFLQQLTRNNQYSEAWLGGFYLENQWLWLDGSWFYNNTWSSESPDSSNPCLLLSPYMEWNNSPCSAGGYASICVIYSNVPQDMLCPEGWAGFQGRCYYQNNDALPWPEADAHCAGLEASLVSVHSPEEYFFLFQKSVPNGFNPTWLGGFYLDNQWMWLDGSWFYPGFYTQMSTDNTSPCLSTFTTDAWSNFDCDVSFPSFCVKNAVV